MIITATLGVGLIFLLAGIVRVLDAVRAARWRLVAAERRESWEARHASPATVLPETLAFEPVLDRAGRN
jgi:hypothetical protein